MSVVQPLRRTLLLLLPLAWVAAAQAALLPRWPRVADLPARAVQRQLDVVAQAPVAMAQEPSWRSAELALSRLHRITLPQGLELEIQRMAVLQRPAFQLALATRPWTGGRRDLALGSARRVLASALGHQANGPVQQRGQRREVHQTCLLAAGAGVTADQLTALSDQGSDQLPVVAARLLGLRPNRTWQCLMVSLSYRAGDRQALAAAAVLWPRLLRALTPLAS